MPHVSRAASKAVPRTAASFVGAPAHARYATARTARAAWLSHQAPTGVFKTQPQCCSYSSSPILGSKDAAAAGKEKLPEQEALKNPGVVIGDKPDHLDGITRGIAELSSNGRWTLVAQGAALERSFRFKNFTKTWDFMTAVALQCKLKNHHPEWSNVYNTVFVRWTTHSAPEPGLSIKDIEMAKISDGLGKAFGELAEGAELKPKSKSATATKEAPAEASTEDVGPTCKMQSLADTAKGITGGDCCNHTPLIT
ncbi:pterin 4 alpha carbinolamine dehydratase [Ophiostoma piceae UAMH 11346]|uniref:4a-hydroxytetrahydrobiopterin dehydratase n=1 Tax=Ophiostoma piceae (strain UAMH 11346) TaxID=1262450 RepID=S3BQ87_OPHP1|nr:pterin 4 alpha carbinolamine dehydratase [Ophiostoma piceae UAMH 11346]